MNAQKRGKMCCHILHPQNNVSQKRANRACTHVDNVAKKRKKKEMAVGTVPDMRAMRAGTASVALSG
jgi:hypothetical protein